MSILEENWCAFCLAIIKGYTPDQSFEVLYSKPKIIKRQNRTITKKDVQMMVLYNKTMTYKEIGEMFGLSKTAVYRRMKNQKGEICI